MMRMVLLVAAVSGYVLNVASTQAQPARVFVSGAGSDSNACTFLAPCRTFQHAHDSVATGGEIDVLTPAGYGPLTITQAISIQGHGFSGISAPSGNAITINAGASDKINLRGLLIDGVGSGNNGILFNAGGSLNLQDSLIRNFSANGINFAPSASSTLLVSNTVVTDSFNGFVVQPPSGSGAVIAVLERVHLESNSHAGSYVFADFMTGGTISVTVTGSVIAGNGTFGIIAQADNGAAATAVMVRESSINNNGTEGIEADGSNATIRIARCVITGNGTGWTTSGGGVVSSYADNNIDNNTNGNTAPPPISTK